MRAGEGWEAKGSGEGKGEEREGDGSGGERGRICFIALGGMNAPGGIEARVYSQAVGNTLSNIRWPNVVGPTLYQCFK